MCGLVGSSAPPVRVNIILPLRISSEVAYVIWVALTMEPEVGADKDKSGGKTSKNTSLIVVILAEFPALSTASMDTL